MNVDKIKNLRLNDIVYVYSHEYKKANKVVVTGIEGVYKSLPYSETNKDYDSLYSVSVKFNSNELQLPSNECVFSLVLSDDKSRRGVKFTGFLEIEDLTEYINELKKTAFDKLKTESEYLTKKYDNMLKDLAK